MIKAIVAVAISLGLTGCGTTNNFLAQKTKTVEYYRIFDIKTSANKSVVSKAASDGLGRNISSAKEATPIPASGEIPAKPGRFKLVNPLEGSRIAALASSGNSLDFRVATCDGANWIANAERRVTGSNNLRITACLFPYVGGYHLDLYAIFSKQEGGLAEVSRKMASAMVGTPEEWTEKTFLDTVRSIRNKTGAEIAYIEGEPELSGTPWLDSGDAVTERK